MRESVRILRFAIVGTSNALIAAVVIWLLMDVLGCNYLWSNVAGYAASLVNNFVWSKYWVFTARRSNFMQEIPLFLLAFGCAYATQFLFLLFLVEGLGINEYFGQFLGLFVYGAVNFLMNRKITFKQR
ncbi:MAG: GtrA family protein [Parabacteroides sp.]